MSAQQREFLQGVRTLDRRERLHHGQAVAQVQRRVHETVEAQRRVVSCPASPSRSIASGVGQVRRQATASLFIAAARDLLRSAARWSS
jgi:hypothetical protein